MSVISAFLASVVAKVLEWQISKAVAALWRFGKYQISRFKNKSVDKKDEMKSNTAKTKEEVDAAATDIINHF